MHADDLMIVEVDWEDAYSQGGIDQLDGWRKLAEDAPHLRRSVGYLVANSDARLAILQTVNDTRGDDALIIPKSLVRNLAVLGPV